MIGHARKYIVGSPDDKELSEDGEEMTGLNPSNSEFHNPILFNTAKSTVLSTSLEKIPKFNCNPILDFIILHNKYKIIRNEKFK